MAQQPLQAEESMMRRTLRMMTGHTRRPDSAADVLAPEIVCVSHREPYADARGGRGMEKTTGGLVSALDAVLRDVGGSWIASGEKDRRSKAPEDASGRTYDIQQLGLSATQMDHYYAGFSNRVLWPVFHYFIGRVNFQPDEWAEYSRVNYRFAEVVARALSRYEERRAVAWIHDYHLLLAPKLVRQAYPDAVVGFFLHTPFPAYEVFRILPTRREILEGMLGADLIGFHTAAYVDAFLDTVRRLLGARVDRNRVVEYGGHRTRTIALPVGIDVAGQAELAADPRVGARAQRLRKAVAGDSMILGVDRLDYSKGILERFSGFERLLERHPEHRGQVTLVQVAVPSRTRVEEYRKLKRLTDEAVGRINGRFGDGGWTPVHYLTRALQPPELTAYYRAADVALVTPLRDGLNLVAKEYVASRGDSGGALVLSEFAGAADELPQAYFVNPFGPDSIAEALHAALTDDRLERHRRMAALQARVRANDVRQWAATFLQNLVRGTA
jgi:trehalose 6-phosphate synthase